ncbi:MAG: type II toxin-antitoxin system HigB family toxin [Pirellulales bacterium]|nr:type II toxin-antitoxin system HigB family toxin [Pirellulales bacterium]
MLAWYKTADKADWQNFSDVRVTFGSADLVGDCIVFNIRGNKFRLVVKIDYRTHRVFVGDVMTHREYDKGLWKKDCNCFAAPRPARQPTSEKQPP